MLLTGCAASSGSNQVAVDAETLAHSGGAYTDPKPTVWLSQIGQNLARHAGDGHVAFTFTILDTGDINAFSAPGGAVYVTRGLVALANNEAEVAAILSHEIGHIVLRHQAERDRRGQADIRGRIDWAGAALRDLFSGSAEWRRLAGLKAAARLSRFSRQQEDEADRFAQRLMADCGYDPAALASLLTTLRRQAELHPDSAEPYGDTHPLTVDRAQNAAAFAVADAAHPIAIGRSSYLRAVDGMIYGDGPGQGYVRGRSFVHPGAGFVFELPDGFHIRNAASALVAARDDGAAMVLTSAAPGAAATPRDYLTQDWASGMNLRAVEPLTVNGLPAAAAMTRLESDRGPVDVRLVAIGWSPSLVYRLVFIMPEKLTAELTPPFMAVANSFRPLSPGDAARLGPLRIKIVTAKRGDSVATLSRRMALDRHEDQFRILNGLTPADIVRPGQQFKIVE